MFGISDSSIPIRLSNCATFWRSFELGAQLSALDESVDASGGEEQQVEEGASSTSVLGALFDKQMKLLTECSQITFASLNECVVELIYNGNVSVNYN
jgi:hypothetical protein